MPIGVDAFDPMHRRSLADVLNQNFAAADAVLAVQTRHEHTGDAESAVISVRTRRHNGHTLLAKVGRSHRRLDGFARDDEMPRERRPAPVSDH